MADDKQTKLIPPIAAQDFELLGQVCLDFDARPRPGITLKDILVPSYWMTVVPQLKPSCEIRVIPADHAWYAKLLVLSCDRFSANVAVIMYSDFSQKSIVSADQFEVRPTNNNTKHGVFRKADGAVIKGGFMSEKQASDFLGDYVRSAA